MKLTTFYHAVHFFFFRSESGQRVPSAPLPLERPVLNRLALLPASQLPTGVKESVMAQRYLQLLGAIRWDAFPQRASDHPWPGPLPYSPVPFLIALLIKLDQKHRSLGQLVTFLREHPELVWLAGFPLVPQARSPWGFDEVASVPSPAHFSHLLRTLPNSWMQFLLDETVQALQGVLPDREQFGKQVALDTKHVLAWVKENNPKAYIKEGRFDKTRQPAGDKDCRLGCKRRTNQTRHGSTHDHPTPDEEALPGSGLGVSVGEFYWGYASGLVTSKVPEWGEFVLAEMTQTFDQSDVSFFFPLMKQVERRLGFKPPFGTADAAFDAFYIYDYFHQAGGFAAVPLAIRGGHENRDFSPQGLPCCAANMPMPLKMTFLDRKSTLISHERGRYVCPLLYPQPTGQVCPIAHPNWDKGGCTTTMATSVGARLRYQIDRQSQAYVTLYNQRTACERLFSLAVDLGIERPKLRNQAAITNMNTLIYVLLNLRALFRVKQKRSK